MFKKTLSFTVIICFFLTTLGPLPKAHADAVLGLPAPGAMVNLSPAYQPVMIKGLTVHKDNPFLFDFIVDVGQDKMSGEPLKKEGEKLIKYFLASLAIPDKDLWVNLSPYEKNRMIPEALGQTDMGRDLLEQDYILKQITASLIYPEKQLGKTFWDKVYAKAQQMYGTTQVPVNTFNKVWIMADRAEVFEHNQTAFVVDSHLKVMLEEDYLALQKHMTVRNDIHSIGANIVRAIILPELEKEVNTGKNFANLRQIFNSVILSSWYKKNLKETLLNQVYSNKSKVNGVIASTAKQSREQIYEQYLKAYKKGVFNYIKEDVNNAGETIPRKYFSGGTVLALDPKVTTDLAMGSRELVQSDTGDPLKLFQTGMVNTNPDAAMTGIRGLLKKISARVRFDSINGSFEDLIIALGDPNQALVQMVMVELVSRYWRAVDGARVEGFKNGILAAKIKNSEDRERAGKNLEIVNRAVYYRDHFGSPIISAQLALDLAKGEISWEDVKWVTETLLDQAGHARQLSSEDRIFMEDLTEDPLWGRIVGGLADTMPSEWGFSENLAGRWSFKGRYTNNLKSYLEKVRNLEEDRDAAMKARVVTIEEFKALVQSGKIVEGARIDLELTPEAAAERNVNGVIINASFYSIGMHGSVFYYPENSMPEANPDSLIPSAIPSITIYPDAAMTIDSSTLKGVQAVLKGLLNKPVNKIALFQDLNYEGTVDFHVTFIEEGVNRERISEHPLIVEAGAVHTFLSDDLAKDPNKMIFTVTLHVGREDKDSTFLAVISRGTAVDIAGKALEDAVGEYKTYAARVQMIDKGLGGFGSYSEKERGRQEAVKDRDFWRDKVSERAKIFVALGGSVRPEIQSIINYQTIEAFPPAQEVTFTQRFNKIQSIVVNGKHSILRLGESSQPWGELIEEYPNLQPRELVKLSVAVRGWSVKDENVKDITPDAAMRVLTKEDLSKILTQPVKVGTRKFPGGLRQVAKELGGKVRTKVDRRGLSFGDTVTVFFRWEEIPDAKWGEPGYKKYPNNVEDARQAVEALIGYLQKSELAKMYNFASSNGQSQDSDSVSVVISRKQLQPDAAMLLTQSQLHEGLKGWIDQTRKNAILKKKKLFRVVLREGEEGIFARDFIVEEPTEAVLYYIFKTREEVSDKYSYSIANGADLTDGYSESDLVISRVSDAAMRADIEEETTVPVTLSADEVEDQSIDTAMAVAKLSIYSAATWVLTALPAQAAGLEAFKNSTDMYPIVAFVGALALSWGYARHEQRKSNWNKLKDEVEGLLVIEEALDVWDLSVDAFQPFMNQQDYRALVQFSHSHYSNIRAAAVKALGDRDTEYDSLLEKMGTVWVGVKSRLWWMVFNDESSVVRSYAAQAILDRGGYKHADVLQRLKDRSTDDWNLLERKFLDQAIRFKKDGYDFEAKRGILWGVRIVKGAKLDKAMVTRPDAVRTVKRKVRKIELFGVRGKYSAAKVIKAINILEEQRGFASWEDILDRYGMSRDLLVSSLASRNEWISAKYDLLRIYRSFSQKSPGYLEISDEGVTLLKSPERVKSWLDGEKESIDRAQITSATSNAAMTAPVLVEFKRERGSTVKGTVGQFIIQELEKQGIPVGELSQIILGIQGSEKSQGGEALWQSAVAMDGFDDPNGSGHLNLKLKDIGSFKFEAKRSLPVMAVKTSDKAALANPVVNGGIDLNTSSSMNWKISKDGRGVEMNIDPAMIERVKREGIESLSPVIFRITPIASIWPLVGLESPVK